MLERPVMYNNIPMWCGEKKERKNLATHGDSLCMFRFYGKSGGQTAVVVLGAPTYVTFGCDVCWVKLCNTALRCTERQST